MLTGGEHGELDGLVLDALVAAVPEIGRAIAKVKAITVIMREQDHAELGAWLGRCRDGSLSGLAEGLRRDRSAVEAPLTLPWSTSPTEEQINRVKMLKRVMYDRAELDLLRVRLLMV